MKCSIVIVLLFLAGAHLTLSEPKVDRMLPRSDEVMRIMERCREICTTISASMGLCLHRCTDDFSASHAWNQEDVFTDIIACIESECLLPNKACTKYCVDTRAK